MVLAYGQKWGFGCNSRSGSPQQLTNAYAFVQTLCGAHIGIPTSLYQSGECSLLNPLGFIPHFTFFATIQPDNILAVAHNNQNTQH